MIDNKYFNNSNKDIWAGFTVATNDRVFIGTKWEGRGGYIVLSHNAAKKLANDLLSALGSSSHTTDPNHAELPY